LEQVPKENWHTDVGKKAHACSFADARYFMRDSPTPLRTEIQD